MRLSILLLSILTIFFTSCTNDVNYQVFRPLSESPGPGDEDDPLRDSLKQLFLDELYFAAEGTNVDSIRRANRKNNYRIKKEQKEQTAFRNNTAFYANGQLEATWHERGPNNEAGDMREIDFVPATEELYGISSVGHLWKGSLSGNDWVLLNDGLQFEPDVLEVVPHNGSNRIFAIYGDGVDDKKIRFSDDEGENWTQGTGFSFYDHWGKGRRLYVLSDDNTLYYLVHTWSGSPWGQLIQLYKSTDKGVSYTKIWDTPTGYTLRDVDLWKPHDSDQMYLIDNIAKEYIEITHDFGNGNTTFSTPVSYASQGIANEDIHVSGRYNTSIGDYELFIIVDDNQDVYKTSDGAAWTFLSNASDNVWQKSWLADPNNNNLYVGSFQLNKTLDLVNWQEQYPQWWVYYSQSKDSMHVDIMNLDYFEKTDGTPFILICNHAGVHITYNSFNSTTNLGWTNLNVTTLYDQTTASDGFLYCGAQDKGTFVYTGDSKLNYDMLATMNTTTGDGMIGVFFNNEQSYFSMIQNGSFACIPDRNTSNKTWYDIPGNHKSGWINPMVLTPDISDNKAYMAGGNLNGGDGCYLILMDVDISSGVTFNPTQYNYDFRANSNSGTDVIKAIGIAMSDEDRLYVATKDATFFYSENGGSSWSKSAAGLPSSMIPWDIVSSDTDPDKLFICGTGFSNDGVYQSNDGGDSFSALSGNIPSATFYEVALSELEDLLYAATSEGPYVYIFADAQWYSLQGAATPILDFNTVDNIGNNTIRFGTYGRGVWDLEIESAGLPIVLKEFKARLIEEQVLTSWVTAIEKDVDRFEVQHSIDGIDFRRIGSRTSAGDSEEERSYQLPHSNPSIGINYYRLKSINLDGTFEYSDIESVLFRDDKFSFNIFPNPLPNNSPLNIKTGYAEAYTFELFDELGRLLFKQENLIGQASLEPVWSSGMYMYRITAKGKMTTGRLMVK